jgi:hypothetical protein
MVGIKDIWNSYWRFFEQLENITYWGLLRQPERKEEPEFDTFFR